MKLLKNYMVKITSGLIPALLPVLHIYVLYIFWGKYSRRVDKRYCSCSCWDTVFKGTYESGVASYKHMYFNSTRNTMKIWLITATSLIIFYECLKYELKLLMHSQLRLTMALLFVSSIFSHYYTWWVYVNYWNDDFYFQWNHQLFFTVTEIISTSLVLHFSNSKELINGKKIFTIISIAVIHILSGSLDQFVSNVFLGEGYAHQILRDLAFLIPDILHIIIPATEFLRFKKQNSQFSKKNYRKDLMYMLGLIICGFIFQITNTETSFSAVMSQSICASQEPVLYLNYQINTKSARLKKMLEKVIDIKKAILELEAKSDEIHLKYSEKLGQLRNELVKSESECQSLRLQIKKILKKRRNMKRELLKKPLEVESNPSVLFKPS